MPHRGSNLSLTLDSSRMPHRGSSPKASRQGSTQVLDFCCSHVWCLAVDRSILVTGVDFARYLNTSYLDGSEVQSRPSPDAYPYP